MYWLLGSNQGRRRRRRRGRRRRRRAAGTTYLEPKPSSVKSRSPPPHHLPAASSRLILLTSSVSLTPSASNASANPSAEIEHLFKMSVTGGRLLFELSQKSFKEEFQTLLNSIIEELQTLRNSLREEPQTLPNSPEEELQPLLDLLDQVPSQGRFDWKHILIYWLLLRGSDDTLEQLSSTLGEHLRILFDQPWFKRMWTLQEALLTNKLVLKAGWAFTHWDYVTPIIKSPNSLPPSFWDCTLAGGHSTSCETKNINIVQVSHG